ncbi:MAG: hypothetical protein K2X46_21230, partial [Roseomonas sp.]|nr:hypothetical protein [Roseomonas sp.]
KVAPMGPWLNIMDETFHMHLRLDQITEVWAVRKPTTDGHVTSFEAYGADKKLIIQCFGERHEGDAELTCWRGVVEGLPSGIGAHDRQEVPDLLLVHLAVGRHAIEQAGDEAVARREVEGRRLGLEHSKHRCVSRQGCGGAPDTLAVPVAPSRNSQGFGHSARGFTVAGMRHCGVTTMVA